MKLCSALLINIILNDSDLLVNKINLTPGIPGSKITIITNKKTGLCFKQYLNNNRINEAI